MKQEPRDHPHKNLSLSRRSDSGKGDRLRPTDGEKFRDGWDRAYGKKEPKDTEGESNDPTD